jgi:Flp pilus assembly pilin Flp
VRCPWVAALRWLRDQRQSPNVQFGLLLAVGAVTLLAGGWMFGKIAEDVVTPHRLIAADAWLAA